MPSPVGRKIRFMMDDPFIELVLESMGWDLFRSTMVSMSDAVNRKSLPALGQFGDARIIEAQVEEDSLG